MTIIEIDTNLDLISFVVEVHNKGIYYSTALGFHFTHMFLIKYNIALNSGGLEILYDLSKKIGLVASILIPMIIYK